MKKLTAMLLSLLMVLGLAACGNSAGSTRQTETQTTAEQTTAEQTTTEQTTTAESTAADNASADMDGEAHGDTIASNEQTGDSRGEGKHILVAYFSATNTTEGVAKRLAEGLDADIYEISPEDPYSDADLDYGDNNSRTTIEMNDPDVRPAISGMVEHMEQYDVIFLGYPIWWGDAPRIMSTFVETYDFSGKTIVPFCTSGGSGIGSSAKNLEQLVSGGEWLPGMRFNGSDSQDTIMEWAHGLGLTLE